MNNNHTVETIKNDLREIGEVVDTFNKTENIRLIDVDIVISKVQNLYDLLLFIKKTSQTDLETSLNNPVEKVVTLDNSPVEKDDITAELEQANQEAYFDDSELSEINKESIHDTEDIKKENSSKSESNEEIKNEEELIVTTTERLEDKAPEIIADKFQNKSHSLNDSLGQNNQKQDLSTKIQSKPIKDLSSSIGVNDKFLFQKVLFKGDKIKYAEAIEKLNETEDFEEALNYIQSNYDWAPNNEAADKLLELVKRKFW